MSEDTVESLDIDINELTLGDMEDLQDHAGISLEDIQKVKAVQNDDGTVTMSRDIPLKALIVLVWIVKRKKNPEFTLADARNVKVAQLSGVQINDDSGNVVSGSDASSS